MNIPPRSAAFAALIAAITASQAASDPVPFHTAAYVMSSGVHGNSGDREVRAFVDVVHVPDAPWLRLSFKDSHLGERSYLKLTSLANTRWQRLDGPSMANYSQTSAALKGGTILVELFVAPGEEGVFANIDRLVVGERGGTGAKSLCGSDNRTAINDPRVGRILYGGCTGWLVANGTVLAAGHCAAVTGVYEVRVPASDADGTLNPADPDDQYPILAGSEVSFDNGSVGGEYDIFRLGPNSNTGQDAHIREGFIRVTQEVPSAGATIRITGYGRDETPTGSTGGLNAQNKTEQTHTGPYIRQASGAGWVYHEYTVDTMPANSGSPILWEANGFSIGIHTDGGCDPGNGVGNFGTSFNFSTLATALTTYFGSNVRHADSVTYPNNPAATGSIFRPYRTLNAAASGVPSGGQVRMVEGSYTKAAGNTGTYGTGNKAFTIVAPVGTVVIGN